MDFCNNKPWEFLISSVVGLSGFTLTALILAADRAGFELTSALSNSPHLADTLMINGERCPVSEHGDRVMLEGDQVYLLAPIAGG
jgi:hypothetical protein